MMFLTGAFVLGHRTDDLKGFFTGLGLGVTVNSIIAIIQAFWWRDIVWPREDGFAGLFINQNTLTEIAVLALIGCVAHRLWWIIPGIVPAIVLTNGRGAWLAGAVAGGVWLWGRSKPTALVLAAGVIVAGVVIAATGFKPEGIAGRLEMWRDTLGHISWFGSGLGSFYTLYPFMASGMDMLTLRPEHVHNDFLEVLFETGLPGFALLSLFVSVLLVGARQNPGAAAVFVAFLVECFFGFASHLPASALVGILAAGHLARGGHSLRDLWDAGRGLVSAGRYSRSYRGFDPALPQCRIRLSVRSAVSGRIGSPVSCHRI